MTNNSFSSRVCSTFSSNYVNLPSTQVVSSGVSLYGQEPLQTYTIKFAKLICDYCGTRNKRKALECRSCGAPI